MTTPGAASTLMGRVIQLFPDDNYGILLSHDQRELRFHPQDVQHGSFALLRVGSLVQFRVRRGADDRLLAQNIEPVLRPHAPHA